MDMLQEWRVAQRWLPDRDDAWELQPMTSGAAAWFRFGLAHPDLLIRRIRMGRRSFADAPWDTLMSELGRTAVILEAGAADGADTLRLQRTFPDQRFTR